MDPGPRAAPPATSRGPVALAALAAVLGVLVLGAGLFYRSPEPPAALFLTPSGSPSSAAPPLLHFAEASAFLARQPGFLGIVVRDRRTDAVWRAGATDHLTWAASTVKLAMVVSLLEQTLAPLPSRLPPVERRAVMPAGFAAAAMAAGIKASGRPDLGIVSASSGESTRGVPVAGIFTTNALPAAPVRLSKKHLSATLRSGVGRYGWTRGLVSTSGSANIATPTPRAKKTMVATTSGSTNLRSC